MPLPLDTRGYCIQAGDPSVGADYLIHGTCPRDKLAQCLAEGRRIIEELARPAAVPQDGATSAPEAQVAAPEAAAAPLADVPLTP